MHECTALLEANLIHEGLHEVNAAPVGNETDELIDGRRDGRNLTGERFIQFSNGMTTRAVQRNWHSVCLTVVLELGCMRHRFKEGNRHAKSWLFVTVGNLKGATDAAVSMSVSNLLK
jgi:hypothetical protein